MESERWLFDTSFSIVACVDKICHWWLHENTCSDFMVFQKIPFQTMKEKRVSDAVVWTHATKSGRLLSSAS